MWLAKMPCSLAIRTPLFMHYDLALSYVKLGKGAICGLRELAALSALRYVELSQYRNGDASKIG